MVATIQVSKTTTLEVRGRSSNGKGRRRRGDKIVGYAIVVDDEFTRDVLAKISWHLSTKGYPATNVTTADGKQKRKHLHRLVYEHYHGAREPGREVDHEDRNKLNNVPRNLRMVTGSVNCANSPKRRTNTSGYKGVYWNRRAEKWHARITKDYKRILLGYFTDIHAAARAVNRAYEEHFPEVAVPNPEAEELGGVIQTLTGAK